MLRTKSLIKLILRMTFFGALLGGAMGLLVIALFGAGFFSPAGIHYIQLMQSELFKGTLLGGATGLVLALYAGLLHRNTYKPQLFRYAMAIVALAASLILVDPPITLRFLLDDIAALPGLFGYMGYDASFGIVLLASVGKHGLFALMAYFCAGRYLSDSAPRR